MDFDIVSFFIGFGTALTIFFSWAVAYQVGKGRS
jgi:hypothetical protein